MAGDTSTVAPTNAIVVDSLNMHVTTKNVETATNVYPGRLVMKGTNDDDIVVCDGATQYPVGWAGYEQTTKKHRPATVDTVYAESAKLAVVWGPGMVINGKIAKTGAAVVVGQLLTYAPAGCLTPCTVGANHPVAQAMEAKAGTAAADIIVKSLI